MFRRTLIHLIVLSLLPVLPAAVFYHLDLIDLDNQNTNGLALVSDSQEIGLPQGHIGIIDAMLMPADAIIWVDARREDHYHKRHISYQDDALDIKVEAVWCSEDNWEIGLDHLLEVWDGEQTIIVYCDGTLCEASESVAQRLQDDLDLDDKKILILHGGWDAYLAWENLHD